MLTAKELQARRKVRTRYQIRQKAKGRLRLTVFRSGANIYAQVIDDAAGKTLASSSSLDADIKKKIKTGANKDAATLVGKTIAEKAKKAGHTKVVFDRGGYVYHGRVKALADAAREAGLEF